MKPAVIYCRVSSDRQVREGNGLSSQEIVCRHFAESQGLQVECVFVDDFTGGGDFWRRPGIKSLLGFLDQQQESTAVVFDDLKRFARDTIFHLRLRQELRGRGAYPLCPNFRFEDTPEGNFVETVLAATAELERQQNRRQVISRMRARLEAGFWVFPAPIGYCYVSEKGAKLLVPDMPIAVTAKYALEGFANGLLSKLSDVVQYFNSHVIAHKWQKKSELSTSKVTRFLRNPLYAGICYAKRWNIRVSGKHEPLISLETHQRILDRLDGRTKIIVRRDTNSTFPLRGYITCGHCGKSVTGGWSRGRSGKMYGYYRCMHSLCICVRIERVEEQFLDRLSEASVPCSILDLFEKALNEAAVRQFEYSETENRKAERRRLERELMSLMQALRYASAPTVQNMFEERIKCLEKELYRAGDIQSNTQSAFKSIITQGLEILRSPSEIWRNGSLGSRKLVQHLVFGPRIPYDKNAEFSGAEFSFLFQFLLKCGRIPHDVQIFSKAIQKEFKLREELLRWETLLNACPY